MNVKTLLYALLSAFTILAILCIYPGFTWLENDDLVMYRISNSVITGELETNLVFISPFCGSIIYLINVALGIKYGYVLFFFLLHTICFVLATNWIFLTFKHKRLDGLLLFSVYLICFFLPSVTRLNFTTLAFHSFLGAVALFNSGLKSEELRYLLAAFVLYIGFSIRSQVIMLLIPLLIFQAPRIEFQPKPLIFSSILLITLFCLDRVVLTSMGSDWDYFYAYNKVRGFLQDSPYNWYMLSYDKIRWSVADYEYYRKFFFDSVPKFNLEGLQSVRDNFRFLGIRNLVNMTTSQVFLSKNGVISFIAIGFGFYALMKRKFDAFFILAYFILSLLLISSFSILKERVLLPYSLLVFGIIFLRFEDLKILKLTSFVVLVFGIYVYSFQLANGKESEPAAYMPKIDFSSTIVTCTGRGYPSLTIRLYEDKLPGLNQFYYLGWMTHCPHQKKNRFFTSDSSLIAKVLTGKHYFLIDDYSESILKNYIRANYCDSIVRSVCWKSGTMRLLQYQLPNRSSISRQTKLAK